MLGPLDDAIEVLKCLKVSHPELNRYMFGKIELTIKDGKVFSVGPNPHLRRGKDFHVSKGP